MYYILMCMLFFVSIGCNADCDWLGNKEIFIHFQVGDCEVPNAAWVRRYSVTMVGDKYQIVGRSNEEITVDTNDCLMTAMSNEVRPKEFPDDELSLQMNFRLNEKDEARGEGTMNLRRANCQHTFEIRPLRDGEQLADGQ
ncbi:MAG: hypothetical protein MJE77_46695 [Proteobacteria bacterium]|nr:hypothetical protein [Pseudomonadota bacterium]